MHYRPMRAALRIACPGTLALAVGVLLAAFLARAGAVDSLVPGACDGALPEVAAVPMATAAAARMVAAVAAGDRREGVGPLARSGEPQATVPSSTDPDGGSRARVRITVRLVGPDASAQGSPAPELLRREVDGRWSAVPGPPETRRGPRAEARPAADGGGAARSHTFEVAAPGRYLPAWSHWVQSAGTNTWRVVRGRGAEFDVVAQQPMREVVVEVSRAQLVADPALDLTIPGATYRITPKDG